MWKIFGSSSSSVYLANRCLLRILNRYLTRFFILSTKINKMIDWVLGLELMGQLICVCSKLRICGRLPTLQKIRVCAQVNALKMVIKDFFFYFKCRIHCHKEFLKSCYGLQMRPIFHFIGPSRRESPFSESKQQNLRTLIRDARGARGCPGVPKCRQ